MRYDLSDIEEMRHVPNIGTIIEQIELASRLSTEEMRRYGLVLPAEVPDGEPDSSIGVPLHSDVVRYLRYLVASAYEGYLIALGEAPPDTPTHQVEGYPDVIDPLFDVVITGLEDAPEGFVTASISRRLT